jgi:hypothetical protein
MKRSPLESVNVALALSVGLKFAEVISVERTDAWTSSLQLAATSAIAA